MKTPGVYIDEKSPFPNTVVEVATAVPAFIGYTAKASDEQHALINKPRRIMSMAEFHQCYGHGPDISVSLSPDAPHIGALPAVEQGSNQYYLAHSEPLRAYKLYHGIELFFQNGGGPCYIVSVGRYGENPDACKLMHGIETLIEEREPTIVVIPDAVILKDALQCAEVQTAAINHCKQQQSRVAILDVYEGYKAPSECIDGFRDALGVDNLDYAAAYYPWIDSTLVQTSALSYKNFDTASLGVLQTILKGESGVREAPPAPAEIRADGAQAPTAAKAEASVQATLIEKLGGNNWSTEERKDLATVEARLNKHLVALSPIFASLLEQATDLVNRLPPSGAIAGVYAMVDSTEGVWKAPANVSLNAVLGPAVAISHDEQEELNLTPQGKSVNAIRSFAGEGTLVWGGRTLDGNSLDWRYINVRRTVIMLEQSIKLASKAYVFEANDRATWITMKSMIRNFLNGIWKRGGLAGATPDDAFSVHVGLGETMTSEDIQRGLLRVTVLIAITRPAEFIELTFEQQMHKS